MQTKTPFPFLSVLFILAAVLLCPASRTLLGFETSTATSAIQIYAWVGSILFVLLALLETRALPLGVQRFSRHGILAVLVFSSVEAVSVVSYWALTGNWTHTIVKNQNQYLFEEHPQLVGSLIKNAKHQRGALTYSHNSKGYRSDEFAIEKPQGKIRIVTLGGSTTYGVGVNNNETWPHYLAQELGASYEVINMGVPGYSSRENLIQTELDLSALQPDLAIYYIGLNDLRNINIEGLKADYSDFHQPSLYGAFGLCKNENLPSLASLKLFVLLGQNLGLIETCANQQIDVKVRAHKGVDEHALSIYKQNIERIDSVCEHNGISVLLVPQTLLEEVLLTGDYSWWIPYVPSEEMDDMMDTYNSVLKTVADSNGIPFASKVLEHNWTANDFVDLSHFNAAANKKLAEIVANKIQTDSSLTVHK